MFQQKASALCLAEGNCAAHPVVFLMERVCLPLITLRADVDFLNVPTIDAFILFSINILLQSILAIFLFT